MAGKRQAAGKIIGLAVLLTEHGEAIEADLVAAGWTLDDVPARLPWRSFYAYVAHLPNDSALKRELNGENGEWSTLLKTNAILADLYDLLSGFATAFAKSRGGHPKAPKPYKRPGAQSGQQHIGSGAVPHGTFMEWWEEKSKRRK